MTPSEIAARARRAQELLDHPTFQEVVSAVEEQALADWRGSAPGSVGLREERFAQVRALDALKGKLSGWIEEAAYRAAREERREARKPAKGWSPF